MALIKCPECGKEISDKAPACIHCGYPLQNQNANTGAEPETKLCEVTFIRLKKTAAAWVPCRIFVDDSEICQIGNDETKKIMIPEGLKTITLKGPEKNPHSILGSGIMNHSSQFEIRPETKNVFIISTKMGWLSTEYTIERE